MLTVAGLKMAGHGRETSYVTSGYQGILSQFANPVFAAKYEAL